MYETTIKKVNIKESVCQNVTFKYIFHCIKNVFQNMFTDLLQITYQEMF